MNRMTVANQRATQPSRIVIRCCLALLLVSITAEKSNADSSQIDFFEKQIRPLLVESCIECHGREKQSGGLRLDSREALLRGGENGAAIVENDPGASLLIAAVRRDGDLKMPPKKPLDAQRITALAKWIELGAPWPKKVVLSSPRQTRHWAFGPVRKPSVPEISQSERVRSPVDAFVIKRLSDIQLTLSPPADRRTLIRRATYDLLGLPPSNAEVEAFVNDTDERAWERVIDRLLESPHYGEKWGRHWLDVARYSDSKGYVYAREERFWVHAWSYRDWVVKALNNDLRYDRFLQLQIAADQMETPQADLAAMGFLTVGRRFLGVTHDIIDDRIDVLTRGTMGLTVACARCHDHKYDPIPTRDYYSLYSVFRNSVEQMVPLADVEKPDSDFARELQKRQKSYRDAFSKYRAEASARMRTRLHEYLLAQTELEKYPEEGFDQILFETDIMPEVVRRWRDYLSQAARKNDRVFSAWRRFLAIPREQFAAGAVEICRDLQNVPSQVEPRVAAVFVQPPASLNEVAMRYGQLFSEVDRQWQAQKDRDLKKPGDDPLIQVLYGPHAPCRIPDELVVNIERLFPSAQTTELWKLQGEIDRWLINSAEAPPNALILVDRRFPTDDRVLVRGNPATPGEPVPRQFVEVIGGPDRQPFRNGSGRLELARAIVDPANPLTARVAVNRVWMHHFGAGLVRTPSDFGRRAGQPSHPQLLDWLADWFVAEGWSLKKLHRLIMLSSVYRQDSFGPTDHAELAQARRLDPENRLLWRMNPMRLSFEELRDSALAVTGALKRDVGGKAGELFSSQRRTLYTKVDRQFLPVVLRMFDFANPDLHIGKRSETTVPQQALFFMNHPFLIERSKALASKSAAEQNDDKRIQMMYRAIYQREATPTQLAAARQLIRTPASVEKPEPSVTEWQYGFGEYRAEVQRLTGFTPLPHFNGKAWQGGPQWPDAKLGWVQLTADGGHAGNDKQHAAVRRWTASRAMKLRLESALIHESSAGDGVRAFVVSSRQGLLKSAEVHMRTERIDAESIDVEPGETIDFVVDLKENLNHEEYLWEVVLTELPGGENGAAGSWNSRRDFGGTPTAQLDGWEQLAQVLLASNEFLFVD